MTLARFVRAVLLVGIVFAAAAAVESRAILGIGTRIIGDQLLLKDVLQLRPPGVDELHRVQFNYAIPEPITYIEIFSDQNVYADVNFSYQDDLVIGVITTTHKRTATDPEEGFDILIRIYGLNTTMLNVNPAYILNRDQTFRGVLAPYEEEDGTEEAHPLDGGDEDDTELEDGEYLDVSGEEGDDEETHSADGGEEDVSTDSAGDWETADKIIELGHRQAGDYLIYETYQTSLQSTEAPANHSVTFYYIDSSYVTYVRFTVYDHFMDKTPKSPPIAEYSHFSPRSLKAVLTDHGTTSLFVQMLLYGYGPRDLPVGYEPFMPRTLRGHSPATTEAALTPFQRLSMVMKAHRQHEQQQQQQQEQEQQHHLMSGMEEEAKERQPEMSEGSQSIVAVEDGQHWPAAVAASADGLNTVTAETNAAMTSAALQQLWLAALVVILFSY